MIIKYASSWRATAVASVMALAACTTAIENPSDPRYDMVTPTWGEVFSSLGDVVSPPNSEGGETEVVVEASGETRQAAREEAVRTALQSTVSQLVIADRLVRDSEVVKNEIFATQNGFVTGFEILDQGRTEYGEHEIRARVRVSEDTILNYVALREGAESEVDGASLFAEVRRSSGQREVLEAMIDRFVSGYPWEVVSLELMAIAPVEGRDDRVKAELVTNSQADYFIAFQQFLERVAEMSYKTSISFGRGRRYVGYHEVQAFVRSDDPKYVGLPRGEQLEVPTSYASVEYCIAPRPRKEKLFLLGWITTGVDEYGRVDARCYLLPPGDYLPPSWKARGSNAQIMREFGQGNAIGLLIAFLDEGGRSMVETHAPEGVGECLLINGGRQYPAPGAYMRATSEGGSTRGLPFRMSLQSSRREQWDYRPSSIAMSDVQTHFDVVIRTNSVDFSRVQSFRGRPVIAGEMRNSPFVKKDPASPPVSPKKLCAELLAQ